MPTTATAMRGSKLEFRVTYGDDWSPIDVDDLNYCALRLLANATGLSYRLTVLDLEGGYFSDGNVYSDAERASIGLGPLEDVWTDWLRVCALGPYFPAVL